MTLNARNARIWHGVTAAVAFTALAVQLVLVIRGHNVLVLPDGSRPSVPTRVIRFFSYFTVESNLLVIVTCSMLALNPARDSRVFRVIRLQALFGITVTGIIYSVLLAPIVNLQGISKATDIGMHYASPLLAIVGWLLAGPRPRIDDNTLLLSLTWPAAYVAYSLAHGAASDWYPYPFVDVVSLGYVTVLRNGVGICVLLVGVGALFMYADRRLPTAPSEVRGEIVAGV